MEECDYCGRSFDDEDAYVEHLASSHDGELSRLDQRRVEQADVSTSTDLGSIAVYAGVVLVVAGVVYLAFFKGGASGIESKPLPKQGNQTFLAGVQTFNVTDRSHVKPGTNVNYDHVPPVGGPHYASTVKPGFYENPQPYEKLVHNLEHGHVVIYYDPARLSGKAEQSLRQFAKAHQGGWAAVVVVPNPKENPRAAYVLTAWNHRLSMGKYNPKVVRAFLAEYLGRGPENPVR